MIAKWLERRKNKKEAIRKYNQLEDEIYDLEYQWNRMLFHKKDIQVLESDSSEELTRLYNNFLEKMNMKNRLGKVKSIEEKNFTTNNGRYFLQLEYTVLALNDSYYSLDQYATAIATYDRLKVERDELRFEIFSKYRYHIKYNVRRREF